jgi:hypothetical protein
MGLVKIFLVTSLSIIAANRFISNIPPKQFTIIEVVVLLESNAIIISSNYS